MSESQRTNVKNPKDDEQSLADSEEITWKQSAGKLFLEYLCLISHFGEDSILSWYPFTHIHKQEVISTHTQLAAG